MNAKILMVPTFVNVLMGTNVTKVTYVATLMNANEMNWQKRNWIFVLKKATVYQRIFIVRMESEV